MLFYFSANGLGMRVVGGMCVDAILGAYVVMVIKGGPADVQGHIEEGKCSRSS